MTRTTFRWLVIMSIILAIIGAGFDFVWRRGFLFMPRGMRMWPTTMGGLPMPEASMRPDQPCSVVTHGRGSCAWFAGVLTTARMGCLRQRRGLKRGTLGQGHHHDTCCFEDSWSRLFCALGITLVVY